MPYYRTRSRRRPATRRVSYRGRKTSNRSARPVRRRRAVSRRRSTQKTIRIVIEQPGAVSAGRLPLGQKEATPSKNSRF